MLVGISILAASTFPEATMVSCHIGRCCHHISPAAETGNSAFRSTHELEMVRHRIVSEQCLLSKPRYVVKWKSGIRSEINECFSTSLALERENEATRYRTIPFTIVALKSTDMSQILYHLKTFVTEV